MILRRGDSWTERPFLLALAAIVIVFALILLMENFHFFNFLASLFGFSGSQLDTGLMMVGVNLETGKLVYYQQQQLQQQQQQAQAPKVAVAIIVAAVVLILLKKKKVIG